MINKRRLFNKLALLGSVVCLSLSFYPPYGTTVMAAHSPHVPAPTLIETFSDWVPDDNQNHACRGYYLPPTTPTSMKGPHDPTVILSANESLLSLEGQSVLRGKVTLQQGYNTLIADEIFIERDHPSGELNSLLAVGNLHYFNPQLNIQGTRAEYTQGLAVLKIGNTSYRWYDKEARGTAENITITKAKNILFQNATYTTCPPYNDTWQLKVKQLDFVSKTGRAKAKNIFLYFHKFPFLYLPYLNYPIDNQRHTGFLFPSYGSTSNSGNELTVPFYWNLAPNYDLLLSARWLSERSTEAQTKFRYLFKHSEGVFQWHMLPHDRKYAMFRKTNLHTPPGALSPQDPRIQALRGGDSRHAINYRHASQWGPRWKMNVLFDYVSDDNYFVDLGNDIKTISTIQLPKQANIAYFGDHWTHFFNVEEYQVLEPLSKPINDEIYKRQPQWAFQALYPALWRALTVGLNGEVVHFAHRPDLITLQPVTVGQRYHLRPSVSLPWQKSGFYVTPRIQVDWLNYQLKLGAQSLENHTPKAASRTIPLYDIDTGLFFDREARLRHLPFAQTLEPRLYYLYVPFHDQRRYPNFDSGVMNFSYAQLFRDNRFSGRDRVGDTHQLTLSLTSRFLPIHGGQEWARASIGQIFYFQNRRVSLCEEENGLTPICFISENPSKSNSKHSNLIAQAELRMHSTWSGGLFWEWDSLHQKTDQAAANLQYQPMPQKILNLNYYWLRYDIAQTDPNTHTSTGSLHQADISFFWPINLRWQCLSRWHYDLMQRQTIEFLAGFEYNTCCLALQLVGSRYRQSTYFFYPEAFATGLFAQIAFKGFSSIGFNNPESKLTQKIPGYVSLQQRLQRNLSPEKAR